VCEPADIKMGYISGSPLVQTEVEALGVETLTRLARVSICRVLAANAYASAMVNANPASASARSQPRRRWPTPSAVIRPGYEPSIVSSEVLSHPLADQVREVPAQLTRTTRAAR
jgi:hypothetical protein